MTTTYAYDMTGIRSGKTVGSTAYHFDTLSGRISRQTWGSRTLYFVYDDNGMPYALVDRNGTGAPKLYYYLLNPQGDVLGLMDQNAQIQATYRYDPWGAVTTYTASGTVDTSATSIGAVNPLRYRSYYYDTETGLYYLQTRYYDPAIGRFLNADSYASTGQGFLGCNMFAYCANDPINSADTTGHSFFKILKRIVKSVKKHFFKPILMKIKYRVKNVKEHSKLNKYGLSKVRKKVKILKKRHYDRNRYNTGIPKRKEDVPKTWKRSGTKGGPPAKCHQYSSPDRSNVKYVSPDGHKEAIYDKNGNLVTDPRDIGTYNFCPSNQGGLGGIVGHFVFDMMPWYLWGNSEDDTTKMRDRIFMREIRIC